MNATAAARQRSRVNTELESASRVREKNAALIRDWPDIVRMMFYREGRQWYARSRRPGHLPHRIFHRVSGAEIEVRCECEGFANHGYCLHAEGFQAVVVPELHRSVTPPMPDLSRYDYLMKPERKTA